MTGTIQCRWASMALAVFLAAVVSRAAEVPDPDPATISDPVEKEFEAKLRALRERQRAQIRDLQARKDLAPEQRIEKRRALLLAHQKQLHALDAEYQGRLTPEARARWMERKATRQKKFDKLQRRPRDTTRSVKGGGR